MPSKTKSTSLKARWSNFSVAIKAALITATFGAVATLAAAIIQGFAPVVIGIIFPPPKQPPPVPIDTYYLRVVTIDQNSQPINDAKVSLSISSEPKRVEGNPNTWQFDISGAKKPQNGILTIFASQEANLLEGTTTYQLTNDANPTVEVKLVSKKVVRGQVVDNNGRAIPGAVVSLSGYPQETQTSTTGNFMLPVQADAGQQVSLQIEKAGYEPASRTHGVGSTPIRIVLKSLENPVRPMLPTITNVQGIVKDASTDAPITHAKITLTDPASDTPIFTDSSGRFTLSVARSHGERIRLEVTAPNFNSYDRYIILSTARITVNLEKR
jgi:hypothetical protein